MLHTIGIMVLLTVLSITAQEINLSGTVVNQANVPVKGLVITLLQNQVRDTTDAEGKFLLQKSGTPVQLHTPARPQRITLNGDRVIIPESSGPGPVSLRIFSLNGSQLYTTTALHRGQAYSLADHLTSSQIHIAVITCNDYSVRFSLMKVNNRVISRELSGTTGSNTAGPAQRSAQAEGDSLIIVRKDTVELATFRSTLTDELSIRLDLIPYEVLELAIAENGRYPDEVGQDLTDYPNGIANYLMKTGDGEHDYEAWCSEFVAWAYEAGGYPFTGGRQGGWMLQGSTQIRSWFQQNAEFIDRTSAQWDTFQPAPGDYIRYENSSGGHSGIVRYVSNDTLYSVEGNVNNTVMLRRIARWKEYEAQNGTTYIDGIGRRSGVTEVVF